MATVSTANRVTPLPQTESGPALLVVDDIVMRFGSAEDGVSALDNVSFTVAPGEFLAVIGPSGCGKSTLFNIIGGLLGGYDGRVAVAGEKVYGPHASIGMVFQEESTFPWRTVIENVAFSLEIAGMNKKERFAMPAISSGKATLSTTLRHGNVDSSWNTMPIEACGP